MADLAGFRVVSALTAMSGVPCRVCGGGGRGRTRGGQATTERDPVYRPSGDESNQTYLIVTFAFD